MTILTARLLVHDFDESLQASTRDHAAAWWEAIYRRAFPAFCGMETISDRRGQRRSTDRKIHLLGERSVLIEEKVRHVVYQDFALEFWSRKEHGVPGWIEKPADCAYLAYVFKPIQECYLIPFPALQAAWLTHREAWKARYTVMSSENRDYTTEWVPVPIAIVQAVVPGIRHYRWVVDGEAYRVVRCWDVPGPVVCALDEVPF